MTSTLSRTEADHLNRAISEAWNSKDPSNVIRLLGPKTIWLKNEMVYRGPGEIRSALRSQWQHTLHYQVRQRLTSHQGRQLNARVESEWQDALNGQWYRCSGEAAFFFDAEHRITKIEFHTEQQPIAADDRRLRLDTSLSRRSTRSTN